MTDSSQYAQNFPSSSTAKSCIRGHPSVPGKPGHPIPEPAFLYSCLTGITLQLCNFFFQKSHYNNPHTVARISRSLGFLIWTILKKLKRLWGLDNVHHGPGSVLHLKCIELAFVHLCAYLNLEKCIWLIPSVASSKIEISRGKFVVFLANAVWGPVALRRPEFGGLNWAVPEKKAYTEGLWNAPLPFLFVNMFNKNV